MERRITAIVLAAIGCLMAQAVFVAGTARGKELDKAICKGLTKEKATLVLSGVPQTMKKGHDWAEDNLDQSGLNDIKRYIYIEEQLLFRCPGFAPRVHPNVKLAAPKKSKVAKKKSVKRKKKPTKAKKK